MIEVVLVAVALKVAVCCCCLVAKRRRRDFERRRRAWVEDHTEKDHYP